MDFRVSETETTSLTQGATHQGSSAGIEAWRLQQADNSCLSLPLPHELFEIEYALSLHLYYMDLNLHYFMWLSTEAYCTWNEVKLVVDKEIDNSESPPTEREIRGEDPIGERELIITLKMFLRSFGHDNQKKATPMRCDSTS